MYIALRTQRGTRGGQALERGAPVPEISELPWQRIQMRLRNRWVREMTPEELAEWKSSLSGQDLQKWFPSEAGDTSEEPKPPAFEGAAKPEAATEAPKRKPARKKAAARKRAKSE